jgi:hypothetical protein
VTPVATPPQRASQRARSARFSRRPPSFAVTLVALAIIFALAWMFFLRSGPSASAPVVAGVQGAYTWTELAPGASGVPSETGSFSAVASGNAGGRMSWENTAPRAGTGGSADSAYDAATRSETTFARRTSRLGDRAEHTVTVGSWPPVWSVATRSPLDFQGLAAVVRTAVEDGDESVGTKPAKDGDRAVWRASMRLSGEQVDVVVDQQTGIVTWYSAGDETFTAKVDWDSPPPADETYVVDVPAGTKTTTEGAPYDYVGSPAAVRGETGYSPLVSGLAPDGYRLGAVATSEDGYRPAYWLGMAEAPPVMTTQPVVVMLYTRGLSAFTVEQIGPPAAEYVEGLYDHVLRTSGERLSFQETTLQFGALKGRTALTWYQESGPSLFVAGARRAVFVTGALTRQEIIAFAEGLKPVPASE